MFDREPLGIIMCTLWVPIIHGASEGKFYVTIVSLSVSIKLDSGLWITDCELDIKHGIGLKNADYDHCFDK